MNFNGPQYTKKNWKLTNNKLHNIRIPLNRAKLIGEGSFGKVHEIGTKYVLKTMKIKSPTDLNIFLNEVETGSNPAIKNYGTRIYKWRLIYSGDKVVAGQYIMEHVLKGHRDHTALTLHKFLNGACPSPEIKKMVTDAVMGFWRVTGKKHGDLHAGNIMIIKNERGVPIKALIIDYGASKKVLNMPTTGCLNNFINAVRRNNFENFSEKVKNNRHYFNYNYNAKRMTNVAMFNNKNKQVRRSNIRMLKEVFPNINNVSRVPQNLMNRAKKLPGHTTGAASLGLKKSEYPRNPVSRKEVPNSLLSSTVGSWLFNN